MTKILLDNDFTHVSTLTLNPDKENDYPDGISITHDHCQAQVSLFGGQVLSFKPADQQEVLWLSEKASYQAGKAIRGGIPLCWPWFGENNKQTQGNKSDKHGFARQLPWRVEALTADESGVTLILVLVGEKQHPLWPNAYKLTQTLFFGKSFKQTLAMTNLSPQGAQYSTALHSYFAVSNPKNVSIDALTGVHYHDKLTASTSVQQLSVSCIGEIDREYHSCEKMTIVDNNWQRKIDIVSTNCEQWVLWNPGTELANTMADVHDGGEQEYVCLEAANTQWQELPAGKMIIISQEISVNNI
ncbi:D-hexose-6-phosphate mutarotase [Colwellia psychrerythraea]|uniref:Putative glucose-6-phosphate 1-epimerase n=1 Tax=Colwellia psychrerythraea TaxID=28229 RepID=A0A099L1A3_COLPS|nr:D-hexose-6-phosphate mutarotase [Colwellia psychrerythraea]KGJ96225.1 Aldose 1-epimerase [Colwellia psychrerythraea]